MQRTVAMSANAIASESHSNFGNQKMQVPLTGTQRKQKTRSPKRLYRPQADQKNSQVLSGYGAIVRKPPDTRETPAGDNRNLSRAAMARAQARNRQRQSTAALHLLPITRITGACQSGMRQPPYTETAKHHLTAGSALPVSNFQGCSRSQLGAAGGPLSGVGTPCGADCRCTPWPYRRPQPPPRHQPSIKKVRPERNYTIQRNR